MSTQIQQQPMQQQQQPPPSKLEFYLSVQDQMVTRSFFLLVDNNDTIEKLRNDLVTTLRISAPFRLSLNDVYLDDAAKVWQSGMTNHCTVDLKFRYITLTKVGEGTFGNVYKVLDKYTNTHVAMKRIKSEQADEGIPASAVREIGVLQELQHPNIVRLLDVCVQDRFKLALYFEFVEQDLKKFIVKHQLSPATFCSFTHQLLLGLEHCHNNRVVHRDLKPQNILVTQDGKTIKLADFGLARAMQYPLKQCTPETVTLWYRAPELLLGLPNYTPLIDMWSVGCIMGEMCTGRPMFPGACEIDALFCIFRLRGTPEDGMWDGVKDLPYFNAEFPQWRAKDLQTEFPNMNALGVDLLGRMLQMDPEKRVSPAEVCWLLAVFLLLLAKSPPHPILPFPSCCSCALNNTQALKHPFFHVLRKQQAVASGLLSNNQGFYADMPALQQLAISVP